MRFEIESNGVIIKRDDLGVEIFALFTHWPSFLTTETETKTFVLKKKQKTVQNNLKKFLQLRLEGMPRISV